MCISSIFRPLLSLLLSCAFIVTAPAQVLINELSAAQAKRLLQYPPGGLPRLGALPAWHERDFAVPSWWGSGAGPFGFNYAVGTNVQSAMVNATPVLYTRREFTVSAGEAVSTQQLELLINYDDGFVAYLNGVEVARRNTGAPGTFAWHDQEAFNVKLGGSVETIPLGTANTRLTEGVNVLAIQVHNSNISDTRLLCSATLRVGGASPVVLVQPSHIWRWFAGTHEPAGGLYDATDFVPSALGPNWTQLEFADSTWASAPGALGFDTDTDYLAQLGTNLTSMRNTAISLYMRRDFSISQEDYDAIEGTSLTVDWDDGYVLYLNGYELSRANLPGARGSFVAYNQSATDHGASRDNGGNNPAQIASIPVSKNLLRPGRNVISAQLHNSTISSSDLLLDVRFSGTAETSTLTFVGPGSTWRYRTGTSEIGAPAPAGTGPVAPEFLDWVELKNLGSQPVDLSGWMLSDRSSQPNKWVFPNGVTIPAGGFLVVACSGRDVRDFTPDGLLHTNFALGAKGEHLGLRNAAGQAQSVLDSFPPQNPYHTWGRDPGSGEYRFLPRGTPGAENVPGTAADVAANVVFDKPTGFHAQPLTVALSTSTAGATIRYTLDGSEPTVSNGAVYTGPFDPTVKPSVGPGAGTILREMFQWSAGTIVRPAQLSPSATPTTTQLITSLETPSNISDYYTHRVRGFVHPPSTGNYEFWLATDDDGELWLSSDENPANKQRIASVTGWAGSREWGKFASQKSAPIALVAGRRYYIEALQSEGSGGDNCAVGWMGPGLPGAITVIEGRYLSPPDTLPPGTTTPNGYAAVRARAFAPGRLPSETQTRTYVTGADPRLATVPAIFLTGPAAETFFNNNGIFAQSGGNWNSGSWVANDPRFDYNFALKRGRAVERPATMEIVNPGNDSVVSTVIGARFAGSPWSRPQYQLANAETNSWHTGAHNKPQMNIFFRGEFGDSSLKLPGFIPNSHLDRWEQFRFRAGKNDPYNPFIVDEWMRRSFAAMGAPSAQGFIATLHINGHYKSYFNPTERLREPFFQEFYNSENEWDINYIGEWEGGDAVAYNPMRSFFLSNDFTSTNAYLQGANYWDMENVADYFILNSWGATGDWPHNNYAFARERTPGAKWRFSMWDAEGALGRWFNNQKNIFEDTLLVPENGSRSPSITSDGVMTRLVFRRAYQNAEFRLLFADRIQKHFYNGGVMTRPALNARWSALRAQIEPVIAATSGGSFDASTWNNWTNRDSLFLTQCRNIGLWPVTAAPNMTPFGGSMPGGGAVTLSNPNTSGTIYFTTNGSDPRNIGGSIAGAAYTGPVQVGAPLTLKARVRAGNGEWSPLVEAVFAPQPPKVFITEIHYNPPGPDDLTEFLKVTNVSDEPAPLNGANFTEGIEFTFGDVTLAPSQSVVLVRDADAFAAAYPGVPIGGVFSGALANEGETLTLRDILGNLITTVTYGDRTAPGWPQSPDGDGYSLVLKRPFASSTDPAAASNWRASGSVGGSPGAIESTTFAGDPTADGDGDGHSALVEYALGTSDGDPNSMPQITTFRDPYDRLVISFFRSAAADDVIVDALQSTDAAAWTPAIFEAEIHHESGFMQTIWRTSNPAPQAFLRLRVRLQE